MNQQLEKRTYSAVLCRACRQPIPVPAIVIRLQEESRATDDAQQHDRVFRVRCRSCEAEKPYWSSQIIQVDGEPKPRRMARFELPLTRAARA
jgi:RNase P subunit RPR2